MPGIIRKVDFYPNVIFFLKVDFQPNHNFFIGVTSNAMGATLFLYLCWLFLGKSQCKAYKSRQAPQFPVRTEHTEKEKKAKWGIDGGKTA